MSRLTRYILLDVLKWYVMGFLLFVVLQMTDVISQTAGVFLNYHASPQQALSTLLYNLPTLLNRSLVLAVPFAVLLSFGRMQGDSEIKAMYASGVRPLSLVWPLALPFLVVGALTFWNSGWVAPWANARWYDAWYDIYGMTPQPPTKEMYAYSEGETLFYAGRVSSSEQAQQALLNGVMVQRGNEVITADSGVWNTAAQTWTLTDPWVTRPGGVPQQTSGPLTLAEKDTLAPPRPEADQLSSAQLRADLTDPELQGAERRTLEHQLASRTADSFTAVIFALAAGLLGLLMPNRAWAFAAVLLVIVVYYVPWTLGPQLAAGGALSPALVAWLPNLIFIVLAAALAWRLR
ncbi:LptF/LptG family permease [Deinococcus sp. Marseille-Q6407]|uniref:LptF/LptG family permease n=1 Tax=Deinococcus sp. Marseille-Q6407 TaxID=2969223 RepID=UPI0021BEEB97|nr:LptF/LptG family permease [Deinococcus sp. Marseille-Q6407]